MTDKKNRTTTISIDRELVDEAKARGLNISGICDFALHETLDRLKNKTNEVRK